MNHSSRTWLRTALGAALLGVLAVPASAVVTSTWTVETYQQFDAGDATSAFVMSTGELRPGWDTQRTVLEGDAIWSSLRLANGTVLLGSDANGQVFSFSNDAKTSIVSIPGAIAVVAMTQTSDGTVWAGTMPGNKLWKIDVSGKKATPGPELAKKQDDVETIWSLAASGNTVYAGTGPSGKLFSITGGAVKELFDTEDKRVTAITVTNDGDVWFGTSERAIVFRLRKGETRAMADFAGNEISSLAPYRDGVVAAANDLADAVVPAGKTAAQIEAAEKPTAAKGQAAKPPETGTKPGADKDPSPVTDLGRKGAKKGKGALFRIGSDGRLDQLHALTATYFTSVLTTQDGVVYAGAADKGRVYMVDNDGAVATAFDVDERSVSQLWADKSSIGFATDDTAAAYRSTGRAGQARYVSDVLDAKSVAKFGKLTWIASGKSKIETRSGNTAKPGVGWSEWQSPTAIGKLGGGNAGGKIASPPGRYLQFRVALDDDAARVSRVVTYYVPQNQATAVSEVTVEPATAEKLPTLKDLAAKPRSPILKLKWKVENPDSDDTIYTLEARRDGEANWRPISTGKTPLTAATWEWNTETYPDGWYRVRVTASDAAANSPDRALSASATTTLFAIDNQRPTIDGVSVAYPRAQARAADAISTIAEMAFSVDDGPWQLGTTTDGLYDDTSEDLRIELPVGLARGTHTLAIRVADSAGNVASTSTTFVVK
ncbi:MAG: hypothetical protein ACKV2T_26450 [Kofleriaceae bacterium]